MTEAVFAYHAIADGVDFSATTVTTRQFAGHCADLSEVGYRSTRLDRAQDESHTVALTFDDGYDSVIEHAAPVFVEYGWIGTVFVSTQHIGADSSWDAGALRTHRHMDWSALRCLVDAGWEIGSHGVSHTAMTDMSEDAAFNEMVRSRQILEDGVGQAVTSLSYPFGATNNRLARLAQEAGYRRAVTMIPGNLVEHTPQLRLPRWPVYRIDRGANLLARLDGPGWVRALEAAKIRTIQSYARGTRVRMRGMHSMSGPRNPTRTVTSKQTRPANGAEHVE
jgi:peptidoglycan/xylan/chitin deacetylase (PgdA/CDA1 family)